LLFIGSFTAFVFCFGFPTFRPGHD
jgi:hypothetical protein